MEIPTLSKSVKDKTYQRLITLLILPLMDYVQGNPHTPMKLTWQVMSQTGDIVWSITSIHAPLTWWPPLTPSLCDLIAGLENWDIPDYTWNKRPTLDNEEQLYSMKKKRSLHTGITSTGQYIADVPGCVALDLLSVSLFNLIFMHVHEMAETEPWPANVEDGIVFIAKHGDVKPQGRHIGTPHCHGT